MLSGLNPRQQLKSGHIRQPEIDYAAVIRSLVERLERFRTALATALISMSSCINQLDNAPPLEFVVLDDRKQPPFVWFDSRS